MLEARKFCKLFPKRKANASEAKMAGDSGQLSEPQHKPGQSAPGHHLHGWLSAWTCGDPAHSETRAGSSPVSRLSPTRPAPPRLSCPRTLGKAAIGTGHSPWGGATWLSGPTRRLPSSLPLPLGTLQLHVCVWGGLAPHPAGLLCDHDRKSLHLPGNPLSLLSTGQKPHSPPSRSEHP